MATHTIKQLYKVGELIFAFHHSFLYEAKILETEVRAETDKSTGVTVNKPYYNIHYQGWKDRWDEWVDHSRMLKHNPSSVLMRNKLLEEVINSKTAAKKGKSRSKRKAAELRHKNVTPIDMPAKLQKRLVRDQRLVASKCLVPLPREPTVAQILSGYKAQLKEGEQQEGEREVEVVDGIQKYFDAALGSLLLYRFERIQYAEAIKSFAGKRMSEVYGAEHLLRLFAQLPELVAEAGIDEEGRLYIKEKGEAILDYIKENRKTMLLKDYEESSPVYRRMAH